ncbi:MAG TPA: sigma-70 family RNA polymerase sigma factor [Opitutaceae bacterium]|nr:sigma-70 family RNA polymerase sigma factor [Opitutaceae bacterium]
MPTQQSEHAQWFTNEVQVHEPALRSYLKGKFPSLFDVDDIVQESYARLIRTRENGQLHHTKAYLFAIARNAAMDVFRRKKVVSMETLADIDDLSVSNEEPGAGETLSRKQELEILAEAIQSLPKGCKAVVTLRLVYELPQKEIAAKLEISEFTVKAQLAKGMLRCAQYFENRGIIKSSSTSKDT